MAATASALNLRMISGGGFAGARIDTTTSRQLGTPSSAIGGNCGASGVRLALAHREPAQLPAGVLQRQHRTRVVEHHVDTARNEIAERRSRTAIGDVQQFNLRHALEQLAGEMHRGSVTGGRERDLALVGVRVVDELLDRMRR